MYVHITNKHAYTHVDPYSITQGEHGEPLYTYRDICGVHGVRFQKSVSGKHITDSIQGETRIPKDTCVGKHASLGICVRETRYPGKHISL